MLQATDMEILFLFLLSLGNLVNGSRILWAKEQGKKGRMIELFHSVEIVDISKVNVHEMGIQVELFVSQRWFYYDLPIDPGWFTPNSQQNDSALVPWTWTGGHWTPESFLPAASDRGIISPQITTELPTLRVFMNGTVELWFRVGTFIACDFNFAWYPLDRQECLLRIESYKEVEHDVRYMWGNPAVLEKGITLLQYSLIRPISVSNGTSQRWGRPDRYPFVEIRLQFERSLGHQVILVFTPTVLIVVISWFSFFYANGSGGRASILITCILTLVTMHAGVASTSLPPVNYIKVSQPSMMDVWMVGCMAFVFLALLEFIVVEFFKSKMIKEKGMETTKMCNTISPLDWKSGKGNFYGEMDEIENKKRANRAFNCCGQKGDLSLVEKIDRISRMLFPSLFLAFNFVYWPYLFAGSANSK